MHLHTVLSPCGDIYMSPTAIVEQAKKLHLDMIAICDHNTTRQVKVTQQIGREMGEQAESVVQTPAADKAPEILSFEPEVAADKTAQEGAAPEEKADIEIIDL